MLQDDGSALVHMSFNNSIWRRFSLERYFLDSLNNACEKLLGTLGLIEKLKAEKFDVYIGEQLTYCGSALSHLSGIPVHILVSSCPIQEHVATAIGLPLESSYVPTLLSADYSDQMTYWERIENFFLTLASSHLYTSAASRLTEIVRKRYGNNFPEINDIVKNSPLIFVNVDEYVDLPRPTFHNIVDFHFVVKIDKNDKESHQLSKNIVNVFTTSWAPQTDILAHPRLRLFISHCGYNSLMETALNGVPVLCMGFFADQMRNGRVAERNGWGLAFDKLRLLSDHMEFLESIRELLTNSSYVATARRTQKLIKSKPMSAEERLQKSIRFLEENGGKLPEILPHGRNLNGFVFYNIDVVLGLMAVVTILSAVVILSTKMVVSLCRKASVLSHNSIRESRKKIE
ncbi:UDP-glucoronosyl and UDP-glucosyl transferase domain-containing protein [Ditylenchus destructor]|uniref:glucuronosyltransferase n=1 Tax=Ditylenchus destructor TaxID=166010 RepID=A0AAD4MKY3_9BILA|nr:UDP-glucoronosyl and UDP-glucosyl transferase domain-containing protein [Ditylenchus destructor]